MAFALVQNKANLRTQVNPGATFTSTPTQGNLLVAVLGTADGTTGNVTNPSGWTTRADKFSTASPIGGVRIVEKIAGAAEPTSVTFTDASSVNWSLEIMEFSGNLPSGTEFDAASAGGSAASAATSIQPASLTPAGTNELFVVGAFQDAANGGSAAINSSFTILDAVTFTSAVIGYKIKTDALAENPSCSWTTAAGALAIQATFKASLFSARSNRMSGMSQAVHRAALR